MKGACYYLLGIWILILGSPQGVLQVINLDICFPEFHT